MKKVVRMLGLCALLALAFTACKKNDTAKVTFTATMPQTTTTDNRTHVQGMDLVWDDGNTITVVDPLGNYMDFTLISATDKVATFTGEDDAAYFLEEIETDDYSAFYPAVVDGNDVRMTIPAVQTYTAIGTFVDNLYPMVGFNEGTNFVFQSNCGFLNVSFKAPENEVRQIDKVVLTANEDIAGDLVYAKNGLSYVFVGEDNVITLTCETKQNCYGDLARDFTFILPEGALANGFNVKVYDGETLLGDFTTQNPQNVIVAQQFRAMYTLTLN